MEWKCVAQLWQGEFRCGRRFTYFLFAMLRARLAVMFVCWECEIPHTTVVPLPMTGPYFPLYFVKPIQKLLKIQGKS